MIQNEKDKKNFKPSTYKFVTKQKEIQSLSQLELKFFLTVSFNQKLSPKRNDLECQIRQ